ncbi:hypothetical protein PVK06_044388 [Gossypium arboreum]|uniref:Uncharacterized protein n=1 Tax=Gossypium arboreum TaxID=29729 RepID=A0ABR0MR14_GOSAR|nr:hypothetical protein PVK06_044388 [Gossypium arboreum]
MSEVYIKYGPTTKEMYDNGSGSGPYDCLVVEEVQSSCSTIRGEMVRSGGVPAVDSE